MWKPWLSLCRSQAVGMAFLARPGGLVLITRLQSHEPDIGHSAMPYDTVPKELCGLISPAIIPSMSSFRDADTESMFCCMKETPLNEASTVHV